jgi:predicted acetyltransferase
VACTLAVSLLAAEPPIRWAARSMRSSLRLCRVTRENSSDLPDYSREFADAGESYVVLPESDPEAFLARVEMFEAGHNLPENRVRMTWFWLLRGDRIVASSRLRHELIPVLLLDGGNIGYEVRPSERRRGVGRELLRLTLDEARRIGLQRVLLTTDTTNRGSIGVILANGGVFDDTSVSPNTGRTLNRYWITL